MLLSTSGILVKGRQKNFSTNSYLDVYRGHVNTLCEILTQQSGAYHTMMANIYLKVR